MTIDYSSLKREGGFSSPRTQGATSPPPPSYTMTGPSRLETGLGVAPSTSLLEDDISLLSSGSHGRTPLPSDNSNPPVPPPEKDDMCRCTESEQDRNSPRGATAAAGGAAAAGAVIGAGAAPAAATGILGCLGFTHAGVAAGSWAAGVQAVIGNVAAGSPFAVAQAIGAGAALPVFGFVIGAAAGAAALGGAAYGTYKLCKPKIAVCPRCGKKKRH